MAGFGSSGDDDFISGINITPLVDVVLVLLIIFMITAPVLYQSAINVQLPKVKTGSEAPKSPLNFALSKEGDLTWDRKPLDWAAIPERLKALGPSVSEEAAIISADEATPHGTVMKLIDTLRQSGLSKFAFNVEGATPPAKPEAKFK